MSNNPPYGDGHPGEAQYPLPANYQPPPQQWAPPPPPPPPQRQWTSPPQSPPPPPPQPWSPPPQQWGPPPGYRPPPSHVPPPRIKLRPSAGWYTLPVLLVIVLPIVAVGLFATGVWGALLNFGGQVVPVDVTGRATVELSQGDQRGVFADSVSDGSAECRVLSPTGAEVPITGVFGNYEYSDSSGSWSAFGAFTAADTGTYTLDCPAGTVASLGPNPDFGGALGSLASSALLFFGGPLLGLLVFLVIFVLRSGSKRRQRRQFGRR